MKKAKPTLLKLTLIASLLANLVIGFLWLRDGRQQASTADATAADPPAQSATFKAKTLASVGMVQYTITNIATQAVANKEEYYTNAEYNFAGITDFPDHYWRTTIDYRLKNVGAATLLLSQYAATILDANNVEYGTNSTETFGIDLNSSGVVNPGTTTQGTFYLLSKTKLDLTHFAINISDQFGGAKDEKLASGGLVKY